MGDLERGQHLPEFGDDIGLTLRCTGTVKLPHNFMVDFGYASTQSLRSQGATDLRTFSLPCFGFDNEVYLACSMVKMLFNTPCDLGGTPFVDQNHL